MRDTLLTQLRVTEAKLGFWLVSAFAAGAWNAPALQPMENAGLTWSPELGEVAELLSGEFLQPLGRSSTHQVGSSAMVVTPALRVRFRDGDGYQRESAVFTW